MTKLMQPVEPMTYLCNLFSMTRVCLGYGTVLLCNVSSTSLKQWNAGFDGRLST